MAASALSISAVAGRYLNRYQIVVIMGCFGTEKFSFGISLYLLEWLFWIVLMREKLADLSKGFIGQLGLDGRSWGESLLSGRTFG